MRIAIRNSELLALFLCVEVVGAGINVAPVICRQKIYHGSSKTDAAEVIQYAALAAVRSCVPNISIHYTALHGPIAPPKVYRESKTKLLKALFLWCPTVSTRRLITDSPAKPWLTSPAGVAEWLRLDLRVHLTWLGACP